MIKMNLCKHGYTKFENVTLTEMHKICLTMSVK